MLYRTLIAFTAVVALGCVPVSSNALAAGHSGGHGGGGRAAGGHAMGGHAMSGHAMAGHAGGGHSGRRYAGGRRIGPGYGGGYGCNGYDGNYGYYNGYSSCGDYGPGAGVVGGLVGGALNSFGRY
jgi:hypothetical protein